MTAGPVAGLPMYDWPEVAPALDRLWEAVADAAPRAIRHLLPRSLTRYRHVTALWRDPAMILGQVCSLNPVRDGLGETEVVGTIAYEPPPGLPAIPPGSYYSVIVCRADDERRSPLGHGVGGDALARWRGATVAANGTDSQSGYWSLGHYARAHTSDGPLFGHVMFTGAHRDSVAAVARGAADLAAIDVHSWRLALEHEPSAAALDVIGTTEPTPGVVCVVAWELAAHRDDLDRALRTGVDEYVRRASAGGADPLHVVGYRTRSLAEFRVVAEQVEAAAHRPWHA